METLTQFDRHFRFALATTEADRRKVFALRYQVYCREFRYEKEEDCPGGIETDHFDGQSLHCLLEHRESGRPAGCVRMVLPIMDSSGSLDSLPMERHCAESLEHRDLHPGLLPRQSVCEVSRLAVPEMFRRRSGEGRTQAGNTDGPVFAPEVVRTFPLIGMSLFLAATAMVGLASRHHVFAMMEPRLARLLSLSGFRFVRVGAFMDYHGHRAAYYIDQTQAVSDMQASLRGLYTSIQRQIGPQFAEFRTTAQAPAAIRASAGRVLPLAADAA